MTCLGNWQGKHLNAEKRAEEEEETKKGKKERLSVVYIFTPTSVSRTNAKHEPQLRQATD